jgi:hypothetical protein
MINRLKLIRSFQSLDTTTNNLDAPAEKRQRCETTTAMSRALHLSNETMTILSRSHSGSWLNNVQLRWRTFVYETSLVALNRMCDSWFGPILREAREGKRCISPYLLVQLDDDLFLDEDEMYMFLFDMLEAPDLFHHLNPSISPKHLAMESNRPIEFERLCRLESIYARLSFEDCLFRDIRSEICARVTAHVTDLDELVAFVDRFPDHVDIAHKCTDALMRRIQPSRRHSIDWNALYRVSHSALIACFKQVIQRVGCQCIEEQSDDLYSSNLPILASPSPPPHVPHVPQHVE